MTKPNEHIMAWLRDAHAAEEQAVTMLSNMARRIEHYPDLKARIEQHVRETEQQSAKLDKRLRELGSSPSAVKEAGGKLLGLGQALSGVFTGDEVVKGVLASYAFEHMEIASYRILIAAAKQAGDTETQRICEDILHEEMAMAKWLEDHIETITGQFLARAGTEGVTAKH